MKKWMYRWFSLKEYEDHKETVWIIGAVILSYYVTFNAWISDHALTVETADAWRHTCMPFWQNCGEWYFLHALPHGYSQTTFYMALFGFLLLSIYFLYRKEYHLATLSLWPAYIWHTAVTFLLTHQLGANYDYYLFVFATVMLFMAHKGFFVRVMLILFYFLSTVAKIHPAWVAGTYFSTLSLGLPIFPDWSIPLMTNLVIFMEMVAAWYLLSDRAWLQRAVFAFFVTFHLYSGIFVQYRYPTIVLPTLLIVFGLFYRHISIPRDKKSIAGWVFVALLILIQLSSLFIPGDAKLTLEWNRYGLYMFESNHQCVSQVVAHYADGTEKSDTDINHNARRRCDPYKYWFAIQSLCQRDDITRVAWTFDHSINGEPYLRIVDTDDACALEYDPFAHNVWIRTLEDNPVPVYKAEKNYYD